MHDCLNCGKDFKPEGDDDWLCSDSCALRYAQGMPLPDAVLEGW